MRMILKLFAAPVILVLMLTVWICSFALYCSAHLFGLISTVFGLLGIAVMICYSVPNGIFLLAISFLTGPMGLPIAAAWMLGKVQDLRYWIQDTVYG